MLFQFHHGAIGRITDIRVERLQDICFNSIMVRLGENTPLVLNVPSRCFNSIMVRLGAGRAFGSIPNKLFQFHHGAIGSKVCQPEADILLSFNSIMVRLGD